MAEEGETRGERRWRRGKARVSGAPRLRDSGRVRPEGQPKPTTTWPAGLPMADMLVGRTGPFCDSGRRPRAAARRRAAIPFLSLPAPRAQRTRRLARLNEAEARDFEGDVLAVVLGLDRERGLYDAGCGAGLDADDDGDGLAFFGGLLGRGGDGRVAARAPERPATFTSGIVSAGQGRKIALFFSRRKHAGESLADVLARRAAEPGPPIQMYDALSRNRPAGIETIVANSLAHGRRPFVEADERLQIPRSTPVIPQPGHAPRWPQRTVGASYRPLALCVGVLAGMC